MLWVLKTAYSVFARSMALSTSTQSVLCQQFFCRLSGSFFCSWHDMNWTSCWQGRMYSASLQKSLLRTWHFSSRTVKTCRGQDSSWNQQFPASCTLLKVSYMSLTKRDPIFNILGNRSFGNKMYALLHTGYTKKASDVWNITPAS